VETIAFPFFASTFCWIVTLIFDVVVSGWVLPGDKKKIPFCGKVYLYLLFNIANRIEFPLFLGI